MSTVTWGSQEADAGELLELGEETARTSTTRLPTSSLTSGLKASFRCTAPLTEYVEWSTRFEAQLPEQERANFVTELLWVYCLECGSKHT